MNHKDKNTGKITRNKKIYYITAILVVVSISVFAFASFKHLNRNKMNNPTTGNNQDAKTTSTAPTAQEDFSEGNDRPALEPDADKGDATVSDNQGSVSNIPERTEWSVSSTGEITLYSPSDNQLLEKGSVISGESSLPTVSFRIIDNVSGVISTGELAVVNGKFSGEVTFSTRASEGRLDIFGTKSDGSEFSNIELGIRFRQ